MTCLKIVMLATALVTANAFTLSGSAPKYPRVDGRSRIARRALTEPYPPAAENTPLSNLQELCHDMLEEAIVAINDPIETNLQYIFGASDPDTRNTVRAVLGQLDFICSGNPDSPAILVYPDENTFNQTNPPPPGETYTPKCAPTDSFNTIWGFTVANGFVLCPVFYRYDEYPDDCELAFLLSSVHVLIASRFLTIESRDHHSHATTSTRRNKP